MAGNGYGFGYVMKVTGTGLSVAIFRRAHRRPEGLTCGPCCCKEAWGEKSVNDVGAILVTDGISLGLCQPVLARIRLVVESGRRQRELLAVRR
jgi:hypothetical protein